MYISWVSFQPQNGESEKPQTRSWSTETLAARNISTHETASATVALMRSRRAHWTTPKSCPEAIGHCERLLPYTDKIWYRNHFVQKLRFNFPVNYAKTANNIELKITLSRKTDIAFSCKTYFNNVCFSDNFVFIYCTMYVNMR